MHGRNDVEPVEGHSRPLSNVWRVKGRNERSALIVITSVFFVFPVLRIAVRVKENSLGCRACEFAYEGDWENTIIEWVGLVVSETSHSANVIGNQIERQ